VKKLNRAKIPVTAWILLEKDQGYWTSLDTIEETAIQYNLFKVWKAKYKLEFAAVGLDIEPELNTISALSTNPWNHAPILAKRFISNQNYYEKLATARALIQSIRADGFAVETYQFPTVVDERKAKSTVLAKSLGIPPLSADREVLMLYASFFPSFSDSILWSYARQCQAVGVGSTGGGVEIDGMPPLKTMRWIDLKRDLLLASKAVDNIYIFSLEGCVMNNYMDRLLDLDWSTRVIPPERSAMGISLIRKVGQGVLWTLSHPLEVVLGLIVTTSFVKLLKKVFSR
ncbi:MAG: hypothetical protein Q8R87_04890, partial [Anaerolineaceae bacterium]|nr:hypothetical protein [Anaerolineaceae bacterium]